MDKAKLVELCRTMPGYERMLVGFARGAQIELGLDEEQAKKVAQFGQDILDKAKDDNLRNGEIVVAMFTLVEIMFADFASELLDDMGINMKKSFDAQAMVDEMMKSMNKI